VQSTGRGRGQGTERGQLGERREMLLIDTKFGTVSNVADEPVGVCEGDHERWS
jgi:hypothetical protein